MAYDSSAEQLIGRELERAQRARAPLVITLIDIDDIATVRVAHGDDAAEALVTHLDKLIRSQSPPERAETLRVADSHLVVMRAGIEEAKAFAENLSRVVAHYGVTPVAPEPGFSVNIGLVICPADRVGTATASALRRLLADALGRATALGPNEPYTLIFRPELRTS